MTDTSGTPPTGRGEGAGEAPHAPRIYASAWQTAPDGSPALLTAEDWLTEEAMVYESLGGGEADGSDEDSNERAGIMRAIAKEIAQLRVDVALDAQHAPVLARLRGARTGEAAGAPCDHSHHGRGDEEHGLYDSDCPCRDTAEQCAQAGCGFCRAAITPLVSTVCLTGEGIYTSPPTLIANCLCDVGHPTMRCPVHSPATPSAPSSPEPCAACDCAGCKVYGACIRPLLTPTSPGAAENEALIREHAEAVRRHRAVVDGGRMAEFEAARAKLDASERAISTHLATLREALALAATRLGICADRMRGCGQHELLDEVDEWTIDAARAARPGGVE